MGCHVPPWRYCSPNSLSAMKGAYCIADIRGHFTHHDASFWIERWCRPALSRAALVLPFLMALGQAQIGGGVPCAKLREDESVWPFSQQCRCGCQRVLKAVPAGFGRTELGLTSYDHCFSVFELVGTHSRRRRDLRCYETYDRGVFMDFWSWNIFDLGIFWILLYRLIQYDSILEHWSHYRS